MEEHDLLHIPTNICHLLSFLMLTTITAVRRYLIVILTYVSLTISDVEHFFIRLLDTCISSLGKCLLRFFAYFLIRLFVLLCILLLSCMSSLFILDIYPFSDIWFTNIFSHSVDRDHFVDNFKTVLISNITPLNQKFYSIQHLTGRLLISNNCVPPNPCRFWEPNLCLGNIFTITTIINVLLFLRNNPCKSFCLYSRLFVVQFEITLPPTKPKTKKPGDQSVPDLIHR